MKNKLNLRSFSFAAYSLVLIFLPAYIFRFTLIGSIRTNPLELLILIFFFLVLILKLSQKKSWNWGSPWAYLVVFAAVLSLIANGTSTVSLGIAKGWIVIPIMFYLSIINLFGQDREGFIKSLRLLFVPLFLISLWAILQRLGLIAPMLYQSTDSSFAQYISEQRFFGPFESPNYLTMFIVPVLLLAAVSVNWRKFNFLLFVQIVSILIAITALVLSKSSGGLIALFSGLVVVSFSFIRGKFLKWTALGVISAIAIFFLTQIADSLLTTQTVRTEIYRYSFQLINSDYLFGIGMGDFQDKVAVVALNNPSFTQFGLPYAIHPHNLFLAFWLNLGLVGIIALFGLIISFFVNTWRASVGNTKYFVAAAMSAILIHGLFDTTYFKNDLSVIFWLVFASAFLLGKGSQNNEKSS
ncbi:MAG: O-antigen ligase family protein [Patescibacteria group bacterium]|jgi:O-antigen ligase